MREKHDARAHTLGRQDGQGQFVIRRSWRGEDGSVSDVSWFWSVLVLRARASFDSCRFDTRETRARARYAAYTLYAYLSYKAVYSYT